MNNHLQAIQQAASLLAAGKIVAIPTETVYGLGGCARTPAAIQKIYEIKGRPATNPLIIHLSDSSAIKDWAVNIPDSAWILAKQFWPGPLTLVLQRHPDVLDRVTAGQPTVALRVPNHPLSLALLKTFGGGIAAPSANRYGRISPTTAQHVREELGSKVDAILDGGPCQVGIESTIVYLADDQLKILRQGQITQQAIEDCLGYRIQTQAVSNEQTIEVPGQSLSHYAPVWPLFLCDQQTLVKQARQYLAENKLICVLSFTKRPDFLMDHKGKEGGGMHWVKADKDANIYARELYAHLRSLDALDPACIFVETPPVSPEWMAIYDRLYRASEKS